MRRGAGPRPSETLRPRGEEEDRAHVAHEQAPETGPGRVERWQRLVEARDEANAAAEMMKDAKRRASTIVREAEQKAAEIIAAAEDTVARMVEDLLREQAVADEKRAELSTLVRKLLREVQRIS